MSDSQRSDLSHLPQSSPEEIRAMVKQAGIELPDELMQQFITAWPAYEAMVRRIPRRRAVSFLSAAISWSLLSPRRARHFTAAKISREKIAMSGRVLTAICLTISRFFALSLATDFCSVRVSGRHAP